MLENTEGAIKDVQSRETSNIDEEKQNKCTTQYVSDTTIRKQTQITSVRHKLFTRFDFFF